MPVITVHLIFNAHLDPVWLWPWTAGLDAALATCRSACDRLDAHPDLTFTLGEAWVFEQVERCEPALFERMCAHCRRGRWDISGGWWIQPDCNLPTGVALTQQIEIGRRYFTSRLGTFPTVACNVDSFGHAATLPTLLRAAGQEAYVFLRPQEHEMKLPGRVFRWRSPAGHEVRAFHIAGRYQTSSGIDAGHVRAALAGLPPGIEHTLCLVGVGDHGGGPTERQIAWCHEHADALAGCRLVFSTIPRFFDAIRPQAAALPVHTGELQHHAIGCYSVCRPVKVSIRRAEHRLGQARVALAADPRPDVDAAARYEHAWKRVCFHQFHDTLGGTCLPSAYEIVFAQVGEARAAADELLQYAFRRKLATLPDDPLQRIVFWNPSSHAFTGYVPFEPWLVGTTFQPHWRLLDERGAAVPFQLLHRETPCQAKPVVLVHVAAAAGQLRALRIVRDDETRDAPTTNPRVTLRDSAIAAPGQAAVAMAPADADARLMWREKVELPLPALWLLDDPSDTWSHGSDRYAPEPRAVARWEAPQVVDTGPLMASVMQVGRIGDSRLHREWRVFDEDPWVELRLRVHWCEQHRLLKLVVSPPGGIASRRDGIPAGDLVRPLDGCERPLRDWSLLELANGQRLGVVCPEVFAVDVDRRRARFTLLRSPLMGHHEPDPALAPRPAYSDQGEHSFVFRFMAGAVEPTALEHQARMMQQPLLAADLTRGMPCSGA